MDSNENKIDIVRKLVLEQSQERHFDPRELDKVGHDDFFVDMFVRDNGGSVQKAANAVINCLEWRQRFGVVNLKLSDLPVEYFEVARNKVGRDIHGKRIFVEHSGYHRCHPELTDLIIRFLYYFIENCVMGERTDMYLDLTGAGFMSMDIRMSMKLVKLYTACFPTLFDHCYVYGVPSIVLPVLQSIFKIVPAKYSSRISFVSKEEATARFAEISGIFPAGCSNIRALCAKMPLSEKKTNEIVEYLNFQKEMISQL